MDQHAYLGDPRRELEIHRLLDQIAVPDESISDASSDIMMGRSAYEPESQVFHRGLQSPGRHQEDFFENSINSTIAHTSPLSNLHLNEDSKMDSSMSQNFTRNQESRIMEWSKNNINPAEGIFPQVSAPSMSIEGDIWDSPQDTPQPTMILRSHSSLGTHNQSKKSISNLPVLDLPTHEEKPSREVITFSPNNAEANWYFNPNQNSKRSSTNQSMKFPKNSFSTELMQGSALLSHAANHHFPSEVSLSQIRDNAPIFEEIHRLKSELTNLKVAFRSEQNMHEETKKELYACSNALQEMENEKIELEEKNAELDEKVKLMIMKQKSPESLEQLRGKSLEYARLQVKELKADLAEKEKKIEDYKHALSQRNIIENNSAREKEIEELTYEITKLKILNNSQNKQIKELNEKLEKEGRIKENFNGEFRNVISDQDLKIKKMVDEVANLRQELMEKSKELEKNSKLLKDMKNARDNEEKAKNLINDELEHAKNSLEILQKQVSGTSYERTTAGDYEFQISKVRALYEKKLDENKDELLLVKANCQRYENKIKDLEAQVARLMTGIHNTFDDEAKETIEMLQDELNKITFENKELNLRLLDMKNSERRSSEALGKLSNERKDLECQLLQKEQEFKEQLRMQENMNNGYQRNLEILQNESKNYKDLLTQYEEEIEKYRFASTQHQQLNEKLKKQLEELRANENSLKLQMKDEVEQEVLRLKNSITSITAKSQFEKDELHQRLREKDQEISEIKQELEESFRNNEDKLRMDLEFFKQKMEKEKEAEITKLKKIYNSQTATQTSFDYSNMRDEIRAQVESEYLIKSKLNSLNEESTRKQMIQEMKEKLEQESSEKLAKLSKNEKENFEKRVEELKNDYSKKLESLKSDYSKNSSKMEQDFLNKVKSLEIEYENRLRHSKDQEKSEDLEKKLRMKEEELFLSQKHFKELENLLSETQKNLLLRQSSLISSQEELETIIKKVKDDSKFHFEREKTDLFHSFEQEKRELSAQIEKLLQDLKKKNEALEEQRLKEKKITGEYEEKLQETRKSLSEEIEEYKTAFSKDMRDTEKAFFLKEKKLERDFNEKISVLTQEFNEKLLKEQEKYSEMMSKKDILSKADNQRVKDEVAVLIGEKERELQDSFIKKQKTLKNSLEKELRDKENEIENLKDSIETEKKKVKEEFNEKINNLKMELQRNKRESEKEQKKLAQQLENALETAKKDLEVQHQETLNKEKADWDRKEKTKTKLMQNKFQKELQDREKVLKSEFEVEKNQSLEEQAELFKKKLKQVQEDTRKYHEDLSSASLKEKIHEVELKVRRELQDNYLKTISQLDAQHFQEKEKMREDFRLEMMKRVEDVRNSSLINQEESYFDMPLSAKKVKQSVEDSQELRLQVQAYKMKLEQMERDSADDRENPKKVLETLKKYENELQVLSNEYKNYVLKSKEWLENSNRKKEEWNIEKSKLEEKIRELNEKLADSNALSPEMLSPDETAQLVLGIFKRSSRDSLIVQLLQQNQEFMENLQSLLEADSPRIARHMTYTGNSYEVEASLASARSYSRPKSVDVDLQGRPPRSNHKLASPISISQNYSPDNFVFPYGNYFSST